MNRATVKVSSPSFPIQTPKQKASFKAVLVLVLFALLLNGPTSFAQTVTGCIVSGRVYPNAVGSKQYSGCSFRYGCWRYNGNPTTINSDCDVVSYNSVPCFVMGLGREGRTGQVTIVQCPIDNGLWLLIGTSIAMVLLLYKRHAKGWATTLSR